MVKILIQPQEVEVLYIIPAIRRALAVELKALGMKQKDIASLLAVTEAAVSQYLNQKRAAAISLDERMQAEVKISAKRVKDQMTMLIEIQRLLRMIKLSDTICKIHRQYSNMPSACSVCFEKPLEASQ